MVIDVLLVFGEDCETCRLLVDPGGVRRGHVLKYFAHVEDQVGRHLTLESDSDGPNAIISIDVGRDTALAPRKLNCRPRLQLRGD